jgi:peroxiredoxin
MSISEGEKLPDGTLSRLGDDGIETVSVADMTAGKRVLLVGMPGAFTNTCSGMHMPSLVRNADKIRAKGVDRIVVFVVNDVQVTRYWGEHMGATGVGIDVLADVAGEFTEALGLSFTVPATGFFGRAKRHAMVVNDGVVEKLEVEEGRGVCDMTGGEAILDLL